MKLSEIGLIGLVCAALAIMAFGWRDAAVSAALASAEADRTRDSITLLVRLQDSARTQFENDRSQFANDTLRLVKQVRAAKLQLASLRTQGDSLEAVLGTLGDSTPDSTIYVLRQLAATRLQEARTCGVALDSTQHLFEGCAGLLSRADTLLNQERALRLATERLAETYKRMSQPSIFQKVSKGLPWLAVGVVIGAVLVR